MLRDQIVEKCYSEQLKQRLLAHEELDLGKTLRIARSNESAIREARFSGQETKDDVISVDRLNNPSKQNRNYNNPNFKCHRCGSLGHKPGECRAISMKCNNCQKIGHFARVCRSKTVPRKPYGSQNISSKKKGRLHKKVCAIRREDIEASQESYSESESGEEYVLFMEGHDNRTQVTISGQKIKMVADMGCRQNIISSQLYKEQFRRFPLERTTRQFVDRRYR